MVPQVYKVSTVESWKLLWQREHIGRRLLAYLPGNLVYFADRVRNSFVIASMVIAFINTI